MPQPSEEEGQPSGGRTEAAAAAEAVAGVEAAAAGAAASGGTAASAAEIVERPRTLLPVAGPPTAEKLASSSAEAAAEAVDGDEEDVIFAPYGDEEDMPGIVELIEKDLSEPYSIFTYRYFINSWPDLCFLTKKGGKCVGAVVCKLDIHRCRATSRGYIAMLAVEKRLRGRGVGSKLVRLSLEKMRASGADECVLETEVTNAGALSLYRNMGFVKEKRLHKYYLNGNDAFRLKFLFKLPEGFDQGRGCLGPPADSIGRSDVEADAIAEVEADAEPESQ